MEDFRTALYGKYVSAFKEKITDYDTAELEQNKKWYDYKYLPLLHRFASDARVLELACGPGFFLQYLTQRGFSDVAGVDTSSEQIALARKNGVNASEGDVFRFLTASSEMYDIIIAFDFLEHLTKDEMLHLADSVYSALRPGGMFLVHTPNADGFMPGVGLYGDLTHQTLFNQNSLIQLFSYAGFERYTFKEAGPAPINLKSAARFALWKILRACLNAAKTIEFGRGYPILTHNIIAAAYKAG